MSETESQQQRRESALFLSPKCFKDTSTEALIQHGVMQVRQVGGKRSHRPCLYPSRQQSSEVGVKVGLTVSDNGVEVLAVAVADGPMPVARHG
jgi:hypothetical protein